MYKMNTHIEDEIGYINVVIFGNVMQSLLRVSCSTLTNEQGYDDEYTLPPIIEQQKDNNKNFSNIFQKSWRSHRYNRCTNF